jgi:hypothetical protein
LFADEAYWGGDKRCVGRLQGMITEPWLPIERKGFDLIEVPNYLHVVMLAEPGWVIPAGRYERRYAAFSVSDAMRGEREYFKALHHQIANGGAEAMMWDLQRMDLDGWHPREIPESLLKGSALQEQQTHTLPPLEQWYLSLLQDGKVPGALVTGPTSKKMSGPSTAYTKSLRLDACDRFPRLRFELSASPSLCPTKAGRRPKSFGTTKATAGLSNHWPKAAQLGTSATAPDNGTKCGNGLIVKCGSEGTSGLVEAGCEVWRPWSGFMPSLIFRHPYCRSEQIGLHPLHSLHSLHSFNIKDNKVATVRNKR